MLLLFSLSHGFLNPYIGWRVSAGEFKIIRRLPFQEGPCVWEACFIGKAYGGFVSHISKNPRLFRRSCKNHYAVRAHYLSLSWRHLVDGISDSSRRAKCWKRKETLMRLDFAAPKRDWRYVRYLVYSVTVREQCYTMSCRRVANVPLYAITNSPLLLHAEGLLVRALLLRI